jgi:uncharacterized protein
VVECTQIMKRSLICLLATFAIATGAAAAATSPTEITASGTGSVSLPPDQATVTAAVETNAATADKALAQNNAIYERIVAALSKLGIARNDITLSYYNVNYNPPPKTISNSASERYGYNVSRNFEVVVRNIGKTGSVSDACLGAGATGINGVSFGLSNSSAARGQATAQAVAQARTNAEALARAASLRIVGIRSIELGGAPRPEPMFRATAAAPPTQFDQSNVNVTVSVTVVFTAEPSAGP